MFKLYVKKLIILLNVSVMRQHMVCLCIYCICCREVGPCNRYDIYKYTRYAAASPKHSIK